MTAANSDAITRTFDVTGPVDVWVELESGTVHITAGDVTEATVTLTPAKPGDDAAAELISRTKIDMRGKNLRIDVPRSGTQRATRRQVGFFWDGAPIDVEVTVPSASTAWVKTGSGDILLDGTYGDVELKSGSGSVRVEDCADGTVSTGSGDISAGSVTTLIAKSGSGDIAVETSRSDLNLTSGSGDVSVLELGGNAALNSASGDVTVGRSSHELGIKTASGDVSVRRADAGEITIKTATGSATIGVADGTATLLDCSSVTGQIRSELEPTSEPMTNDTPRLEARARTVSGSVTVRRA